MTSRFLIPHSLLLTVLLGAASLASAAPPPELSALRQHYEKALTERSTAPFEAALVQLRTSYNGALVNASSTAKQAGKLDDVIALQDEQKRLADQIPLPDEDDQTPAVLKPLRAIYRGQLQKLTEARTKSAGELLPAYTARLQQLETTLTQADRIEEAKEVRTYRETLGTASAMAASVPSPATPPGAAMTPKPAPAAIPDVKGDDRAAAEIVFKYKGEVQLTGSADRIKRLEDLPKGRRFTLQYIGFPDAKGMVIEPADLPKLAGLGELASFLCSYGPFTTDDQLSFLATCPKVRRMDVQNMPKFTGAWLQYLQHHDLVMLISVSSMHSDASGLAGLRGDSMATLQLRDAAADDSSLASIGQWKKLQSLNLRLTQITDAGMQHLSKLPALVTLNIIETKVTSAGLKHLSRSPVDTLGFGLNMADPGYLAEIPLVAAQFPKITRFYTPVGRLSAAHVQAVGKAWPGITKLIMPSFAEFDADTFADLPLYLPKLTIMELWSTKLADTQVAQIAQHKQVSELYMSKSQVTDQCLPHLEKMKSLKVLTLSDTPTTEAAVAALRKARPDLQITR